MGGLDQQLLLLFDGGDAIGLVVAIAAVAGALHALAPGHGKTLAAAYMVSDRGRTRHAVALGVVVAGMHTLSVAALALIWYGLLDVVPTDLGRVTDGMQLVAALIAIGVGIGLLRQRRSAGHHGHDHGRHGSDDLISRRGLVLLGISGGLVPSPSAFLVLITGLLAGRLPVALGLVIAFATGMALTLALVGILALHGQQAIRRVSGGRAPLARLAQGIPTVAAGGVMLGGTALAVTATVSLLGA